MFNKRGISEIVGYVLLISISFALAGMVFAWLIFFVTPGEELVCDEGTSIAIRGYNYSCENNTLNITLKNDGRFNIAGYIVRVNNRSGETRLGVYTINKSGTPIKVGDEVYDYYSKIKNLDNLEPVGGQVTFVEVQPYVLDGGTIVYCDDVSEQTITCTN